MSGSSAPKKRLEELLDQTRATTKKTQTGSPSSSNKHETRKKFDMNNNTFAKITFSDLSPEKKKEEIAKALTYDQSQSKEENQSRLKEFELFKEYLQSERQRMAQDIIDLTNTDAFAEMHEMFNEMNGAIVEFDESMRPLVEIIDAVWTLRQQGKEMTLDVFKEIQDDKEAQIKRDQEVAEKEAALAQIRAQVEADKREIYRLENNKRLFGLLSPSNEDQAAAAALKDKKAQGEATLATQIQDLETLKTTPVSETKFAEFAQEKAKLRELLDISSDEHKDRQKRLIAAAQNFVNTTDERGEKVLDHFTGLGEHIETLGDANRGIQGIYAILTEASTDAARKNKGERDKLAVAAAEENKVEEMARTNKKADVEEFIPRPTFRDGHAQELCRPHQAGFPHHDDEGRQPRAGLQGPRTDQLRRRRRGGRPELGADNCQRGRAE